MLDGRALVDVHLHAAPRASLKMGWDVWLQGFDSPAIRALYDEDGRVIPAAFDTHLRAEGVDFAMLMSEYSPRVTGWQTVEDMLPLAEYDPGRIGFAANVNPHVHYPVADEVERQLALGAIALKIHPVHAGCGADDRALYPAYEICQSAGLPVVVHCGTSTFPGARNQFADPIALDDVLRDFRTLDIVLAHGGRGWWYDAAAFLALANEHVWIELSGLPPARLPTYYARHNWARLTRRMIFGTDWPGIPGIAANARAVAALLPDEATVEAVWSGNARQVYNLKLAAAA